MGLLSGLNNSVLDKGMGNATYFSRKIGILPDRAKTVDGAASIITGKKEKKKSILADSKKSIGSTLT